jgi:hypothetical protein
MLLIAKRSLNFGEKFVPKPVNHGYYFAKKEYLGQLLNQIL